MRERQEGRERDIKIDRERERKRETGRERERYIKIDRVREQLTTKPLSSKLFCLRISVPT